LILDGEPPEEGGEETEAGPEAQAGEGVRPRYGEMAIIPGFYPLSPHPFAAPPPYAAKIRIFLVFCIIPATIVLFDGYHTILKITIL
jgi:hypothetical protein